jgi:CDK-activating kinase assembly factor MAT1
MRLDRFNRRESEFDTLLDYNNYLEKVEDLTFNLMNNIDVAATEATLASHAAQNASSISRNAAIIGRESASVEAQLAAQKEELRQRRLTAKEEEEQERREREEGRKEIQDKLANSSGNADQIMREGQKIVLKKSTARRTAAEKARQAQSDNTSNVATGTGSLESSFQIRGLKPVVKAEREKPYDPFGGLSLQREYSTPQEHMDHPWLEKARTDPQITAGGYDLKEYYARTLLEAFAGLGCFIGDEMAAR